MPEDILIDLALQRGFSQTELAAGREAYQRKQRLTHPKGRFDQAGRFFLDERCDCCAGIRAPSAAHPHSEMVHGRSLTHIASLYQVHKLHVRRLAKAFALARECDMKSNHCKAQFLVKLGHILKPVPAGQ